MEERELQLPNMMKYEERRMKGRCERTILIYLLCQALPQVNFARPQARDQSRNVSPCMVSLELRSGFRRPVYSAPSGVTSRPTAPVEAWALTHIVRLHVLHRRWRWDGEPSAHSSWLL